MKKAASNGHLEVVKYLVSKGAEPITLTPAAIAWSPRSSKFPCRARKYIDIHAYGEGALRWAASNGHIEVVKYLYKTRCK